VLVVARLEDIFFFDVFILVVVARFAVRQDRAEHVAPEPRERERRGLHHAADHGQAMPDRVQHVAHAQRRRDHDGDHQADEREQRGARGRDHRAQDLREVLAERATRTVPGDAIARCDQVDQHRERHHAERGADRDHRRQRLVAIEQHTDRGDRTEHDERVAGDAGDAVEEPGDRAAERAHHHVTRLQRHHRDQKEQRGAQPDHSGHFPAPVVLRCALRTTRNSYILGHRALQRLEHLILHGIT